MMESGEAWTRNSLDSCMGLPGARAGLGDQAGSRDPGVRKRGGAGDVGANDNRNAPRIIERL